MGAYKKVNLSDSSIFGEEMVIASDGLNGETCVPASTVCVSDCCRMALEFVFQSGNDSSGHYVCTGCKKQCQICKAPALFDAGEIKPLCDQPLMASHSGLVDHRGEQRGAVKKQEVPDPTAPMVYEPPLAGANISPCGKYRWSLWRRFRETGKKILWLMLNPSTADHVDDDATIRRLIGFSKREGAALMVVCNLFAYRTTYPKELKESLKTQDDLPFETNFAHIQTQIDMADMCIVAWGNGGDIQDMARKLYGRLRVSSADKVRFMCLGVTKSGQPKHPLRLSAKTALVPFEYKDENDMAEEHRQASDFYDDKLAGLTEEPL